MQRMKLRRVLLFVFFLFFSLKAQSLTGLTGLISIPSAEVLKDKELTIGSAFYNKDYINLYAKGYHGLGTYITLGFLPFAEISFKLTRLIDFPESQALGDRMVSMKIQLYMEDKYIPSVLVGMHDLLHSSENVYTSHNSALYFSLTKNYVQIFSFIDVKLVLGYGLKYKYTSNNQFEGLFYGVSLQPITWAGFMIEYDTKIYNVGFNIDLFNKVRCTMGLMNFKEVSFTFSYSFIL